MVQSVTDDLPWRLDNKVVKKIENQPVRIGFVQY